MAATGGRNGRPSKVNQVVRHRTGEDGKRHAVTAGQVVVERVRLGQPRTRAANSSGVDPKTLTTWEKAGAAALAKEARGERLDATERAYAGFLLDIERAEDEFETNSLAIIHRVADGGFTTTKTTRRSRKGQVVEEVVVQEQHAPQWTARAWLLERRLHDTWGRRRLELSGPDGDPIPIEERASSLAEQMRAYQQGRADAHQEVAEAFAEEVAAVAEIDGGSFT